MDHYGKQRFFEKLRDLWSGPPKGEWDEWKNQLDQLDVEIALEALGKVWREQERKIRPNWKRFWQAYSEVRGACARIAEEHKRAAGDEELLTWEQFKAKVRAGEVEIDGRHVAWLDPALKGNFSGERMKPGDLPRRIGTPPAARTDSGGTARQAPAPGAPRAGDTGTAPRAREE